MPPADSLASGRRRQSLAPRSAPRSTPRRTPPQTPPSPSWMPSVPRLPVPTPSALNPEPWAPPTPTPEPWTPPQTTSERTTFSALTPMRALALLSIRMYQCTLSRLLPPACRFWPTCSRYAYEAIDRYGVIQGGWMALRRLARCHPFHPGGYDPVP